MTVCAIFGCKNRMQKGCGKHFFRFPMKDPERLAKWVEAVQRDDWIPTVHSKVCSDHFTEKDYMIRPGAACPYLRLDAVPTSFYPAQRRRKTKKRKYTRKSGGSPALSQIKVTIENVSKDGPCESIVCSSHEQMMEVQDAQEVETQKQVVQDGDQREEAQGGKPGGEAQSKVQGQVALSEKQGEVEESEQQVVVVPSKKQVDVAQRDKEGEVAQSVKQGEISPREKQGQVAHTEKQVEAVKSNKQGEAAPSEKLGEVAPSEKLGEATPREKQGVVAPREKQGEATHPGEKLGEEAAPPQGEETQDEQAAEMLVDVEDTQGRKNMAGIKVEKGEAEAQMSGLPSENGVDYIPVDHAYSAVTSDKENDVPAPSGNPKIVKLRKKIKTLQKQVLRQGVKIKSLKQSLVDLRRNNLVEKDPERILSEHCSGLALALFTNQLKNGHKRYNAIQYCGLMKEFALNLYHASPKAYKFCRLFLCLPHPVSLRHWKMASEGNPEPVAGEPLQDGPVQVEPLQDRPVQGEPLQDGQLQEEPLQGETLQEGSL